MNEEWGELSGDDLDMEEGNGIEARIEIKRTWKGTDQRWEREKEQRKRLTFVDTAGNITVMIQEKAS